MYNTNCKNVKTLKCSKHFPAVDNNDDKENNTNNNGAVTTTTTKTTTKTITITNNDNDYESMTMTLKPLLSRHQSFYRSWFFHIQATFDLTSTPEKVNLVAVLWSVSSCNFKLTSGCQTNLKDEEIHSTLAKRCQFWSHLHDQQMHSSNITFYWGGDLFSCIHVYFPIAEAIGIKDWLMRPF